MGPRRRWSLIALAAAAAGVAAFVAPEGQEAIEVSAPVRRARAVPAAAVRPQAAITDLPAREVIGKPGGALFAGRSWAPPPSAVATHQPSEPTAPANPYRFAGTSQHNGVRKVFLVMGDRIFEAKEGEALERGFRVQSVTADAVTLVFEPLDIPVTIATVFPDASTAAAGGTAP